MLSCFSLVQLFVTLWTIALQAPLSMGFSRQEYWSGLPFPSPGNLPDPGIKPAFLMSPALESRFFTTSATWEVPWHKSKEELKSLLWGWKRKVKSWLKMQFMRQPELEGKGQLQSQPQRLASSTKLWAGSQLLTTFPWDPGWLISARRVTVWDELPRGDIQ